MASRSGCHFSLTASCSSFIFPFSFSTSSRVRSRTASRAASCCAASLTAAGRSGTHFLRHSSGLIFPGGAPASRSELVTRSTQDAVEGRELLRVEFDGGGKIGHVFLAPLLGTHLPGRRAGILTGLNRASGIEPVGKRPKNSTAQKRQEQGKRGGESGLGHDTS